MWMKLLFFDTSRVQREVDAAAPRALSKAGDGCGAVSWGNIAE